MIQVEIKLFGAFRKFLDDGELTLTLERPVPVSDLRDLLAEKLASLGTGFDDRLLLQESAFADEESILDEGLLIAGHKKLAVLPPVCGG